MNFALANKSPIVVTIDGTAHSFPPMRRRQWIAWAAELDAARRTEATAGMQPAERARFLSVATFQPTDMGELARLAFTPAGIERIVRDCGKAGGVPEDVIEGLLEQGHPSELQGLALVLAAIVDPDKIEESPTDGERADPLPSPAPGSPA